MVNSFAHYINQVHKLIGEQEDFVTVSLVAIKGSAPQELGAKLIATKNGLVWGSVGGGKIEAYALEKVANILSSEEVSPHSITVNLQKDIGMTCGGEVTLLFEPHCHIPSWEIVIFGAGHVSQALSRVLSRLNCHVTVIDTRQEWIDKLPQVKNVQSLCVNNMAEQVGTLSKNSFVVIITMGHATDLPILKQCLAKNFPYLGVIGSRKKRKSLESELPVGLKNDFICPIGEKIGTNEPEEIALSITAQLMKYRDKSSL
jgi:xanthine dehydrogenase accessory factor